MNSPDSTPGVYTLVPPKTQIPFYKIYYLIVQEWYPLNCLYYNTDISSASFLYDQ